MVEFHWGTWIWIDWDVENWNRKRMQCGKLALTERKTCLAFKWNASMEFNRCEKLFQWYFAPLLPLSFCHPFCFRLQFCLHKKVSLRWIILLWNFNYFIGSSSIFCQCEQKLLRFIFEYFSKWIIQWILIEISIYIKWFKRFANKVTKSIKNSGKQLDLSIFSGESQREAGKSSKCDKHMAFDWSSWSIWCFAELFQCNEHI